MQFYVGLDKASFARHFERSCISVNTLRGRVRDFDAGEWMMDSGAFTEITRHGEHRYTPQEYAAAIRRWSVCGKLVAAVSQDYMCEPFVLARTDLSVRDHQRMTVERYDAIRKAVDCAAYTMPVLQGFWPEEYVAHVRQYGPRLAEGQWVGVGSVCKRNKQPEEVEHVLMAIKRERPDLRLHGFGVKLTALASGVVRSLLYSADSMAWSYWAWKHGRDVHDWKEAARFVARVEKQKVRPWQYQGQLFGSFTSAGEFPLSV